MAARSWNRIEIMGNLTRDPELRYTPNGAAVCTFSVATNRTFTQNGETREEVDFHRCVAWNKLAELCNQLLKKGNKVFISGRLQYREWEDQEQKKRRDAEIVVEDMILINSPSGAGRPAESAPEVTEESIAEAFEEPAPAPKAEPAPKKEEKMAEESLSDDDLPF